MKLEPVQLDASAGLDDAHRELFDLYNRIVWACQHETAVLLMRERIRTFLLYASWHFALEEEHMRDIHYPARSSHMADHARLLQDAEDFIESLGYALKSDDTPAIASYFSHWLARHTTDHDDRLREFIKQASRG